MKGFAIIFISVAMSLFSSCALYIVGDDDHPRRDDRDTLSITITHGIGDNGKTMNDNNN
jgi:hypothetical protein